MLNHVIDRAVFRIFRCASTDDIEYVRSVVDLPYVSFYDSICYSALYAIASPSVRPIHGCMDQ